MNTLSKRKAVRQATNFWGHKWPPIGLGN